MANGEQGLLEVQDLKVTLGGKKILDGLTLSVWAGHVHAIIGPNGAGKSTLANCIMGLHGYSRIEGDIRFAGESIKELSLDQRAKRGITLAWQEPARYEGLAVGKVISAGAKDKSLPKQREVLALVGLDPDRYLKRAVDKTLSGGERKRIELASILAMEPRLVLMDEPDSGIDVEALNRIFAAIKYLKQRQGTVVLITHSLAVLKQADHAFLMCNGKLVDKGSVEKIDSFFGEKCLPCDTMDHDEKMGRPDGTA